MTSAKGKCLVIGLGNPFRSDDGVGLKVASELRKRELPAWIEVVEGGGDELGLIEHLGEADHVVLVDAVCAGGIPGAIHTFSVEGAGSLPVPRNLSLHTFGFHEAIGISRSLGAFATMSVVGMEPNSTAPGDRLSETVRLKIPEVVEAVLRACSVACGVGA